MANDKTLRAVHVGLSTGHAGSFDDSRPRLVHRRTFSEVEQALGSDRFPFGQAFRKRQYLIGQSMHGHSPVRNIDGFLTVFNLSVRRSLLPLLPFRVTPSIKELSK